MAMKKIVFLMLTLDLLASTGCATKTGSATAGALGGAAAGGGAYEYRMHQELQRIEDDHNAGKMDQKEYEIRKDEIQRMLLLK
jgi:hypothetical protein